MRFLGHLLCIAGFHGWEHREEHDRRVSITYSACRRCPVPERIVDIEIRSALGHGICSCRKGGWQPDCEVHGRTAA